MRDLPQRFANVDRLDVTMDSIHSRLSQLCHSSPVQNDDLVSSTKCRKLRKQLI